jgi:hypothetical protein
MGNTHSALPATGPEAQVKKCGRHVPRFQPLCKAHVADCPNKDGCNRDCGTCRYIRKSNKEMEERMKSELRRRGTLKD